LHARINAADFWVHTG